MAKPQTGPCWRFWSSLQPYRRELWVMVEAVLIKIIDSTLTNGITCRVIYPFTYQYRVLRIFSLLFSQMVAFQTDTDTEYVYYSVYIWHDAVVDGTGGKMVGKFPSGVRTLHLWSRRTSRLPVSTTRLRCSVQPKSRQFGSAG